MKSYIKDDSIVFDGVDNLNIALTLDCGTEPGTASPKSGQSI